jgi:hypothetical protein
MNNDCPDVSDHPTVDHSNTSLSTGLADQWELIASALRSFQGVRSVLVTKGTRDDAAGVTAYVACDSRVAESDLHACIATSVSERDPTPELVILRMSAPVSHGQEWTLQSEDVFNGSAVERVVAGIWCQVLSLKCVSRDGDFFSLGGHSLHAMQVTSRMAQMLDVSVPWRSLFDHTTLAALSSEIVEQERAPGLTEALASLWL